jgi:prophage tail gpP-like protein
MLALAGEDSMGSGLTMGGDTANVQIGNYRWNVANVMSDYYVWYQSYLARIDLAGAAPAQHVEDNYMESIGRKRFYYILCEQVPNEDNFALLRAQWEANHREGMGQTITATIDRWRDDGGMLWAPNFNITVNMPQLKVAEIAGGWVISTVTFSKDNATGQTVQLTLNPKYTYDPEPAQQDAPENADLLAGGNANAADGGAANPNVLGQPVGGVNQNIVNPVNTETLPDGSTFTKDAAGNIIGFTAAP